MTARTSKIVYEWCVETHDEYGDIVDNNFSDECPGWPTDAGVHLVLIRDDCKLDGRGDVCSVSDRAWAYVENGELPETFDNGERIPKRFRDELARTMPKQDS